MTSPHRLLPPRDRVVIPVVVIVDAEVGASGAFCVNLEERQLRGEKIKLLQYKFISLWNKVEPASHHAEHGTYPLFIVSGFVLEKPSGPGG